MAASATISDFDLAERAENAENSENAENAVLSPSTSVAEIMDPLGESQSQLKVGLKGGMSHTPL
jgi:hypothetical protein